MKKIFSFADITPDLLVTLASLGGLLFLAMNPANPWDGYMALGLEGYLVGYLLLQSKMTNLIKVMAGLTSIGGLLALYLTVPTVPLTVWLVLVSLAGGLAVAFILSQKHKTFAYLPLSLIIITFVTASVVNSVELRHYLSVDPPEHTYTHDMGLFLKTFYYMDDNHYYPAYSLAIQNHAVFNALPQDVWSWRLPTAFYLWRSLGINNAIVVYYLFLTLAGTTLFYSYKLILSQMPQFPSLAVLGAFSLSTYLRYPARDWTILQVEWWAICFVIIGFGLLSVKKTVVGTICLSLGNLTRELLLGPLGLIATLALFYKRKHGWYFFLPPLAFLLLLAVHAYMIGQQVELGKSSAFQFRYQGGLDLFYSTLAFGSWEVLSFAVKPYLLLAGLMTVGYLFRPTWVYTQLMTFLGLPLSYLVVGTSHYNWAWGVLYVPIILISYPLAIGNLSPWLAKRLAHEKLSKKN